MTELTDEQIQDFFYTHNDLMETCRAIIAADRELQAARHAEELAAYALTVANLRTRNEELIADCVASELRAQPDDLIGDCVASISAAPAPSQPERKPMTYEQIDEVRLAVGYAAGMPRFIEIINAVEAFHGISHD